MLNTLRSILRRFRKPREVDGHVYLIPLEKTLEIKRLTDALKNKRGSDLAERFRLWIAVFRAVPNLPEARYIIRDTDALRTELVEQITEDEAEARRKENDPSPLPRKGIFAWLLITAMGLSLGACTRPNDAKRVLEQSGYTEVQITGYRPFMAGNDDSFSTGFRAKGPSGKVVTGAVTGGAFKGNTIRLD